MSTTSSTSTQWTVVMGTTATATGIYQVPFTTTASTTTPPPKKLSIAEVLAEALEKHVEDTTWAMPTYTLEMACRDMEKLR